MGHRLRCVVLAANVSRRRRVGHCVCQSGEERNRAPGWPHRFGVGRQSEAQQAEGGVEGETAGGVHEAAEGGLIGGIRWETRRRVRQQHKTDRERCE